ncbi:MAG: hypothetical protein ACM3W4_02125 [Ignavibacteriales bacterium]
MFEKFAMAASSAANGVYRLRSHFFGTIYRFSLAFRASFGMMYLSNGAWPHLTEAITMARTCITEDLKTIKSLHAALDYPVMTMEVITDFAEMTGVSEQRILTMVRMALVIGDRLVILPKKEAIAA